LVDAKGRSLAPRDTLVRQKRVADAAARSDERRDRSDERRDGSDERRDRSDERRDRSDERRDRSDDAPRGLRRAWQKL